MWLPSGGATYQKASVYMKNTKIKRRYKDNLTAYAFLTPTLIIFFTLVLFPIVFSAFLSFTEWNFLSGLNGIKWVGLQNFKRLLADKTFMHAVKNTFVYTIATVPVSICIALILAYILNSKVYAKSLLRLCFFVPYISSAVALAAVFKVMFRENGPINMILQNVFMMEELPRWFADSSLNKIPIIVFLIWTSIGYELVIYMAAIQNISPSLLESAELDGAGSFKQFTKITVPLISPTTFYLVIVRLIETFKLFTAVNIMTFGTPARANTTIVTRVYEEAFYNYKFGYASAEAWVLVAIILLITVVQFWGQKKWVHY